jgi:nuclear transport factor 2 (NTF2) superfamily protein
VSVKLDPGQRYAFRYIDEAGRWFNEDDADAYEYNEFGETNCIIDLRD